MAFNLYRLGVPSIWFDEAFSVELARQPLPLLWHIIFGPEPNMELYYLFLHFWLALISLLGLHAVEFVVRFPSTVFAALSTVIVFLLGRRFIDTIAGVVGASLYLLNDLQLTYAQQTRSYSLQLLLVCIAWYALLAALIGNSHTRRWWVCYVMATTLAVSAHLFSVLIVLAQLVAVVGLLLLPGEWRARVRKQIVPLAVSLVVTAILIIPMLAVSRQGSKTGWLPIPHLNAIYHLFLTISGNSKTYLLLIFVLCACALVMAALCCLSHGRDLLQRLSLLSVKSDSQTSALQHLLAVAVTLVCWLVIPIGVSYVVSHGATRIFSSRYLVIVVPPLFLLVGLGVAMLRWRIVQAMLGLGLILLAVRYVPLYYASAQVEDWNVTSHWIEQHYQPKDGLVCYDNVQGCQISVEYYLHAYPSVAHFTADSPGAYSWANFGPVDPLTGYEAAVQPKQLVAYGDKHPRLFFIVGRVPDDVAAAHARVAQVWLDTHYHLVGQINTRTVTVRLYAASATL
ncbi:MAG: glycosyltransferase family 39 protein [Ktedonobacteraceae bacterium]|nr:glycosyltransferase family 39 protein [Ktedonobacteraceae bacterium]